MAQNAVASVQLTTPGATPFHLRAVVFEQTNPENEGYNATIEEYWLSPDRWTRTVTARDFSQTLTMDGAQSFEILSGDYSPLWLRILVSAIFDPGAPLKKVDMTKSNDNPMMGGTKFCRRFEFRAGIPPVNRVFSTYCFENDLPQSVSVPGYGADYLDYRAFGSKQVARNIQEWIKPGETVEADITELEQIPADDVSHFPKSAGSPPLQTIEMSEERLRPMLADSPAIDWSGIHQGKPKGVLSLYVSIDRSGHVREMRALNSDNPFATEAARERLEDSWRFKPAVGDNGDGAQMAGILTFTYETSDALAEEERKRAQAEKDRNAAEETGARGYWVDPLSGLMWAGKDNGKDVSWKDAMKYCRNLRLAGFSDWRLASLVEMEWIYDKNANSPGINPKSKWHDEEPMTYHVKGGLFLSGTLWTSTRISDDRGKPSGYAWRFDFHQGRSFDGDEIWFTTDKKALCVRNAPTAKSAQ